MVALPGSKAAALDVTRRFRGLNPWGFLRRRGQDDSRSADTARFPLLRYFLGTTLVLMVGITLLVGYLFIHLADRDFEARSTSRGSQEAAHIAHIFYNTVWAPVHELMPELSFAETVHPQMMDVFARRSTYGLGVVGLTVWDLDGAVLWSSDPEGSFTSIGNPTWYQQVAIQGEALAELQRDWTLTDLDGEERQLDVVRTYYPVMDVAMDSGQQGNIVGVIEITQDVTADMAAARSDALSFAVIASLATGSILFTLLLLIILRADRSMERGHRKLLKQQEELQEAQAQRMQSTKLAAVGELVASVAHELNNPLAGIWGISQLMMKREGMDGQLRHEVEMIHQEAGRSSRIVQNLLSFARARESEKSYTSINAAVEAALELRRYHLLVNDITVDARMHLKLPRTLADPHKIQQVALNLIINAEQAMLEAANGGHLTVQTSFTKDMIRLTVGDTGPGIPQEQVEKIFDPFFTTKDDGKGTGLGLSICYSIVQEHGGFMRVKSVRGEGTQFIVELPITAPAEGEKPATLDSQATQQDRVSTPARLPTMPTVGETK